PSKRADIIEADPQGTSGTASAGPEAEPEVYARSVGVDRRERGCGRTPGRLVGERSPAPPVPEVGRHHFGHEDEESTAGTQRIAGQRGAALGQICVSLAEGHIQVRASPTARGEQMEPRAKIGVEQ